MKKLLGHKRITSMALSALLLLSAASAALTASAEEPADMTPIEQVNYYGDFEKGEYKTIQFLNFDTAEITNEQYFSGGNSLKAITKDNYGTIRMDIDLEPNTVYAFSMSAYAANATAANSKGTIRILDKADSWKQIVNCKQKIGYKNGGWNYILYCFTTGDDKAYGTGRYRFEFADIPFQASFYFDNIKLEKVAGVDKANLINADFEDLDAGLAAWSNESVLEISDESVNDGNYSAYIYGAADTDKTAARWTGTYHSFAVEKNTNYRLTYYAQCKNGENSPIIKIHPFESSSTNLLGQYDKQLNETAADRTKWTKNTLTFNSGDNNLLRLFLVVNNYGAYIDDISIDKLYSSVVYATGRGDAAASRESFTVGEAVTLTATPADGAVFSGWYDGETLVSTDAAYTFTPTDSFCYTARFTPIENPNVIEFVNPGFESDDLSAWSNQTPFEIITTDKHSGEKALRVKANGEAAQWAKSYKGFYIEPNTDYVVHFYGKRESGDESYTLVHIMDKSNNKIKGDIGVNGLITGYDSEGKAIFDHSQWGLNEIKFNSGNHNYIRLCFQVSKGASYIDDIYIARKVGTYSSENTEYGTVKGTAPTLCYGEEFTITAEPKDGYVFAGWYNSANELVSENAVYTNTLTSNESYVAKFAENTVIQGDVNGDGNVDATDLTVLRKVLLGIETSDNANVNGDKNVDILDYIALKKLLAK